MDKPVLLLFISIISVSFAAIFIVSAESPPLTIAFYRLLFTLAFISPLVMVKKRYRCEFINLSFSQKLLMAGIGVILAAHFAFWITSLTKTSVASSVILVTTHPLLVAPISHFFLKEKLNKKSILGIIISLFGIGVLVVGNYGLTSSTFQGNMFALVGGIAAGLYILGGRKMRQSVSTPCYAVMVYGTACFTLFLLCLFLGSPITNLPSRDYGIFLLMALISGIFGHTLYNWVLKYIGASLASVSLLGEPLVSSALALFLPWINQIPTKFTFVGGCFILVGIYLTSRGAR